MEEAHRIRTVVQFLLHTWPFSTIIFLAGATMGSWLTAITSLLVSRFSVKSSIFAMSQPMSKGEERRHHKEI